MIQIKETFWSVLGNVSIRSEASAWRSVELMLESKNWNHLEGWFLWFKKESFPAKFLFICSKFCLSGFLSQFKLSVQLLVS